MSLHMGGFDNEVSIVNSEISLEDYLEFNPENIRSGIVNSPKRFRKTKIVITKKGETKIVSTERKGYGRQKIVRAVKTAEVGWYKSIFKRRELVKPIQPLNGNFSEFKILFNCPIYNNKHIILKRDSEGKLESASFSFN